MASGILAVDIWIIWSEFHGLYSSSNQCEFYAGVIRVFGCGDVHGFLVRARKSVKGVALEQFRRGKPLNLIYSHTGTTLLEMYW